MLQRSVSTASWTVGGVAVDEIRVYHEDTRRIETPGRSRAATRSSCAPRPCALYSVAELTDLLATAGFASFQALDDDLEAFAPGADRLWLLATTPG